MGLLLIALGQVALWRSIGQISKRVARGQVERVTRDQVERCEQLNARSQASFAALSQLARASALDRNPHTAAIWREYLAASRKNPLPKCQ